VDGVPVLPSFNPSYLLNRPTSKREAWADLLAVRVLLDG
jgi:DNA polymerase